MLQHEVNLIPDGDDGPAEELVRLIHLRECLECRRANWWWHRLPSDDPRWHEWCHLVDHGVPYAYKLYRVERLPDSFPKITGLRGKSLQDVLDWGYARATAPTFRSLEWGFEILRNPYNIIEITPSELADEDEYVLWEKSLILLGERLKQNNL
jgi:hypothetical protein